MLVCNKASVLVLSLYVTVDELHEKELFKSHPFVEYLLCVIDRESCKVFTYR